MRTIARLGGLGIFFAVMASSAAAAPITTQCGSTVSSISKTEIDAFVTNSEIPVTIPGTAVVNVPAGASRCVRVRFSAVADCPLSCFLRAFDNTTEMNPAWVANALRFSTDQTNGGTAHSFEWISRVGPGRHVIRITVQTGNTVDNARIGPYTTMIDVAN